MTKYIKQVLTLVFLIAVLSVPFFVFGAGLNIGDALDSLDDASLEAGYKKDAVSPTVIVGNVIGIVLSFLGIIFLAYMVWAGYNWMTAGGSTEKVKEAQGTIQRAIIGLIVVLSAYALSTFVLNEVLKATK